MKNNILENTLTWVYQNFKKNTATVLVVTGTIGWGLSSLAQIGALVFNPKLSKEQKSFLIPQEIADAAANISAFFLITQATKKIISKLASTGKFTTSEVRAFLDKNKDLYGNKVGKLDLDLDIVLKNNPSFPKKSYYAYKNALTTFGTIGAGILSTNIVTPIIRNSMAAKMQNKYIANSQNSQSTSLKI